MNNLNNFQTILLAIFLGFFVFGVMIFSGLIDIGNKEKKLGSIRGSVSIWGTLPNSSVKQALDAIKEVQNGQVTISYREIPESTYQQDLILAFAEERGPDLFFITPDMIMKNNKFFYKIPYKSYTEKSYRDNFIDGADVYLDKEGIIAFPFAIDPLVLYYNKNIFTNEALISPPSYWDELIGLNGKLTKRENDGTINRSMIALGNFDNVNNAKSILSALFIQTGNKIVDRNDSGYTSTLSLNSLSLTNALSFFMQFTSISNSAYSWNRTFNSDLDNFVSGKTAMYLGFASELFQISSMNPNLSFDVAEVPQLRNTDLRRTYGKMYAVATNKKSRNISAAMSLASYLSQGENAKNMNVSLSLPPASRALLSQRPEQPYLHTFFDSAITARSWVDPDSASSSTIFKEMVNSVYSDRNNVSGPLNKANDQLSLLIINQIR